MYNGQWFRENIRWKMGNDSKINFQEDRWLGQTTLIRNYQRLYHLSAKKVNMGTMGKWTELGWVWELKGKRQCFDWEHSLVQKLQEEVQCVKPVISEEDQGIWLGEVDVRYYVRFAYKNFLLNKIVKKVFGVQDIWKLKVYLQPNFWFAELLMTYLRQVHRVIRSNNLSLRTNIKLTRNS